MHIYLYLPIQTYRYKHKCDYNPLTHKNDQLNNNKKQLLCTNKKKGY